jgi:hypothetical protein
MNNLLRTQYHVPPDRVSTAYRVLMDSAEQSGFFHQGRKTQLVEPVIGPSSVIPSEARDNGASNADRRIQNGGGGNGGSGRGDDGLPSKGKLLDGMWEELPDDQTWDESGLSYWLDTFERLLRVRYRVPKS